MTYSTPELDMPTWEELFTGPWPEPTVPCPPAWQGDSVAVQLADQECARLIANALRQPPIEENRRRRDDHNRY